MQPSVTRRSLLATGGALPVVALAGCTNPFDGRELAHDVEIFNRRDAAHALSVAVTNDDGGTLYRRTFRMEAESAEEGTEPFTGTPTAITVTVDGGSPAEYAWPSANCEDRGVVSAGTVDLYLTAEEGVVVRPSCDTVYAE